MDHGPWCDHFNRPFPSSLCIKTRLSAQPLIWRWFFILMQIKLIFTRKVVHLASFWKWGFLEFGSGLFLKTIRGMGTSFRRNDFWDRFSGQAYLVYIFKIFTQLNRDSHWLILGHLALTKIKSVYSDRHVIKHGGKWHDKRWENLCQLSLPWWVNTNLKP